MFLCCDKPGISYYYSNLSFCLLFKMGSMASPEPWVAYTNTKDCSQGFCSVYCQQWCYKEFPPPPPFEFPHASAGICFPPFVIAIIGILGSALLLVSYYAIVSRYCKKRDSSRRRETHFPIVESVENQHPSNHEPWIVSSGNGLDEALIKSITLLKYKKGDGLIEGTDCSVCLSEFQDDESLRLLPNCSHAFHVMCIDTWFKSHSNCPLCRANIAFANASSPSQLPPVMESPPGNESTLHSNHEIENVASEEDLEMGIREAESQNDITRISTRQATNLGTSGDHSRLNGATIEECEKITRSVSMDCTSQRRLSLADVLQIDRDEEDQSMEKIALRDDVGTSKQPHVDMIRSSNRNIVLHCVSSPAILKKPFSSARFLFTNAGREGMN